jgi:hypothetical protein
MSMDKGIAGSLAPKPSPLLGPSTVSFCTKNKPTPNAIVVKSDGRVEAIRPRAHAVGYGGGKTRTSANELHLHGHPEGADECLAIADAI